jgi:hypothetical protein
VQAIAEPKMKRAAQILLASAIVVVASPARAAPCPVDPAIAGDGANTLDVDTRLMFIESSLRDGARKSTIWAATWGTLYGLSMTTLLIVAPRVDRDSRADLWIGAASSAVGLLVRASVHPRVIRENRRLRTRLRERGRTCKTLHEAERALARSAKGERFGRSLVVHMGAIVYNVGVGLVLGLAFERPLQGIRQAAVGTTVGQLMIVTQPMTSVRALSTYQRGALPRLSFTPLVLARGGGVSLAGSF